MQLITDPDPLVQNNTLETIQLLAVDCQCRIALNEANVSLSSRLERNFVGSFVEFSVVLLCFGIEFNNRESLFHVNDYENLIRPSH